MASENVINAGPTYVRDAAGDLFAELASLAERVRQVLFESVNSGGDTGIELCAVAAQLVAQIGYVADAGAKACGGSMSIGGAEEWLLSPVATKGLASLRKGGAA